LSTVESKRNESTTPLGAGETYTGEWEMSPIAMVLVQSKSDVAGTLFFDFSIDGVNADSTFPVSGISTVANIPTVQPAAVGGRFFRVRYINGPDAQTFFRLGSYYSNYSNFYSPLNQGYGLQSPAILARTQWPWLDVSRGLAGGITSIKKFGRNKVVGDTYVPVAIGGNYRTPQSTGATALRVKAGGNANDTAAGSGARSITLTGTDENWLPVSETIVTAGASASASTTATFTRLFVIDIESSGTYASATGGSHAGEITIENAAGTEDWGDVALNGFAKGGSEIGAYTIPAGFTGHVKLRDLSVDSGKTVDVIFFSRANADELSAPYSAMRARSVTTGIIGGNVQGFGETDVPFGPFEGPTDIGYMAKKTVSGGAAATVAVEFEIILIEDL
jgi:hypothetical protein